MPGGNKYSKLTKICKVVAEVVVVATVVVVVDGGDQHFVCSNHVTL